MQRKRVEKRDGGGKGETWAEGEGFGQDLIPRSRTSGSAWQLCSVQCAVRGLPLVSAVGCVRGAIGARL